MQSRAAIGTILKLMDEERARQLSFHVRIWILRWHANRAPTRFKLSTVLTGRARHRGT